MILWTAFISLQWRHNGRDSVSNHQPYDCFLNRLFRRRSKKTPKLRVTGLCARSSPGTGEFPAQMASNTENVSIWWRHHVRIRQRYQGFKCASVKLAYTHVVNNIKVGWQIIEIWYNMNGAFMRVSISLLESTKCVLRVTIVFGLIQHHMLFLCRIAHQHAIVKHVCVLPLDLS